MPSKWIRCLPRTTPHSIPPPQSAKCEKHPQYSMSHVLCAPSLSVQLSAEQHARNGSNPIYAIWYHLSTNFGCDHVEIPRPSVRIHFHASQGLAIEIVLVHMWDWYISIARKCTPTKLEITFGAHALFSTWRLAAWRTDTIHTQCVHAMCSCSLCTDSGMQSTVVVQRDVDRSVSFSLVCI